MSKTRTLKLVTKVPGKMPKVEEIEYDGLSTAQRLVGDGYIEAVTLYNGLPGIDGLERDLTLWCNEEGKLNGMEPNFPVPWGDLIVGPVFFSAIDDEGDTASLTDEECKFLIDFIKRSGIVLGGFGGITVIQV